MMQSEQNNSALYVQKYNQYQNLLTAFRVKEKADFDKWLDGIHKCGDDFKSLIPQEVLTWKFEEVFSELYKDDPDPAVYEEQYNRVSAIVAEVNSIAAKYDEEGLQLLKKVVELQQATMR